MKNISFSFAVCCSLFISSFANAQITGVSLQASGLTCSMCSNAINKSLKSLDFVDKVEANIKNSTFSILFKPGATINIDEIKNKVEDAGFFVASFSAIVHFDNQAVQNDNHLVVNGMAFHFLKTKDQTVNGDRNIRILDKGFVSAKEYKANSKLTLMDCYKTGVAASCCSKEGLPAGTRIYHVTI